MRRRKIIVEIAIAFSIMLLIAWLTLLNQSVTFSHGYLHKQHGHYGSYHADQFSVLRITNADAVTIQLSGPVVQWQKGARVVNNLAVQWDGGTRGGTIASGEAASLPFEVPAEAERFRVNFDYSWSGGKLTDVLSQGVRKLPIKSLPDGLRDWFYRHGLLDGRYHRQFELPWVALQLPAAPLGSRTARLGEVSHAPPQYGFPKL